LLSITLTTPARNVEQHLTGRHISKFREICGFGNFGLSKIWKFIGEKKAPFTVKQVFILKNMY
jgi:hypothetical protein